MKEKKVRKENGRTRALIEHAQWLSGLPLTLLLAYRAQTLSSPSPSSGSFYTGTVAKATLVKLLRDGAEPI